jgi:hypothetical protein
MKIAEIQNSKERIDSPLEEAHFNLAKAIKCRPTVGLATSVDIVPPK